MNAHFEFYNHIYFIASPSSQMVFFVGWLVDWFLMHCHTKNRAMPAGRLAVCPCPLGVHAFR